VIKPTLKLEYGSTRDNALKILCLGAHSDDIEIGCAGTILKLIRERKNTLFYWVVLSGNGERKREAIRSAKTLLRNAKEKTVVNKSFKDGFFPYIGAEIKEYFEVLRQAFSPDLIFTHYRNDLHQDHRLVAELTWNTFRDHLILEYEIPKYDGDLGAPNVFVHLDEGVFRKKIQHLLKAFKSQSENQWFTEETFRSILRLRGIESNSPSGYAEGFYSRKVVLI
jgi:LmbE family N-acetylglucosaminyl deacetylase